MEGSLAPLLARALTSPPERADPVVERILDGALEEVAAHGTRRATMDGVASRAGVSRITVFRRFGTKDALLDALHVRELRRFLADVEARIDRFDDPAERIAEAFVACVRAGAEHPLVARAARVEPGALLEQLRRGDPSPIELGRAFVAAHIRAAQAEGGVPPRDADQAADALVRLALTYVLVPSSVVVVADERSARRFARAVLAPIVTGR